MAASPHPSLPAGRPPPQAPPSQPQRLLTPATSKEAEGEPRAERGPGLAGLGLGVLDLQEPGRSSHPTTAAAAWMDHSVYPVFRLSVQDSQIVQ